MNPNMLKAKIIEKGFTLGSFAKETNIGRSALYKKMKGTSEFSLFEVKNIIKILNLTDEQTKLIFFAN